MKRTNVVLWGLVLGLAGLCFSAGALAGDKAKKGSKSGSASTELDILFRLAGRWKVVEQYPAAEGEEQGPKGKGTAILKKDLSKTYLIGSYATKCRGTDLNIDLKGHMVFTYVPDVGKDSYRFWWFDNYGHQHEFVGHATNNNRALVFTREEPTGDPDDPIIDRRTFTFNGEDEIVYTWEKGMGKNLTEKMTATYTRKGSRTESKEVKVAPKRVMRGM